MSIESAVRLRARVQSRMLPGSPRTEMPTRLKLFGPPRIEQGSESLVLPFERRNQLLAYLALKRSWVGRAELATMFWPEHESKLAYANLRKILFRLQSVPWATIESEGGAVRFEAQTDVFDFESALREDRISDALFLRSGELLAGFEDGANDAWSSWLSFERDRLRTAWRSAALKRLADGIEADEAIELCSQLLEADPLDEEALRAQMTWLARSGQSSRARQVYREFGERLAADLGIEPGAGLQALHDSLATTISAPPLPAPEPAARVDGFVGRSAELRRISALLAQEGCRLLSLIGPGGVGKTRLAQRALRELASEYPDGAVFVPLEDLVLTSEIGGRLAREIGVALQGNREPLDQAIEFLRERRMLLVLDNFEQLTPGAAILEKLLQASPGLRIIVTSRVRLAVVSEWLLPIEGLPCPEAEDLDRIEAFDAARLFIRAAQRADPALVPATDAPAIAEICRQVGGLPLALELAAAWTRVLSCAEIAAELQHGTELLQAVDDAQPERHASIEIVFNQSWRLLGPVERDALAKLSVFRGGFTSEAARAVAGAPLPVLGALADKSLIRKDDARLFLHPLVQQLAARRLAEGAAREATERAHAQFFHRLMAQRRSAVEVGDRDALQQLDTEFENCRTAWRWAVAHESDEALAASTAALYDFWDHRSRFEDGLLLLREAIALLAARDERALRADLMSRAAHFEYRLDRYADAIATANEALALADGASADRTRLQCRKVLGTSYLRLGRHDEAKRCFKQGLKQAPASINPRNAAAMLSSLALIEKAAGQYDASQRMALEAITLQRRLGDVAGEALSLNNLGALEMERRRPEAAAEYLKPALQLCDRHGLTLTRGYVLSNLSGAAMMSGDHAAAEGYAQRALEHAQATGNRYVVCFLNLLFVRFALRRRELDAARAYLRTAVELAIALRRPALLVEGASRFAELLAIEGEIGPAHAVAAFIGQHPSTDAPEREQLQAALASWPAPDPLPPWPGLTLDELLHRIVMETDSAHRPLIALLRG